MTKTDFFEQATLFINTNSKLKLLKLAYDNRDKRVTQDDINYRGIKQVNDFVGSHFKVSQIKLIWAYIKGIKPYQIKKEN